MFCYKIKYTVIDKDALLLIFSLYLFTYLFVLPDSKHVVCQSMFRVSFLESLYRLFPTVLTILIWTDLVS